MSQIKEKRIITMKKNIMSTNRCWIYKANQPYFIISFEHLVFHGDDDDQGMIFCYEEMMMNEMELSYMVKMVVW